MCATLSKGYTFGATETVTNTKLHTLVDSATIADIVNADISAAANIDGSKINTGSLAYLTAGMPSTSISGDWYFTGELYASLASFGTINANGIIASLASINSVRSNAIIASLASISSLNVLDALKATQSLVSISNLYVTNINGSTYSSGKLMIGGTAACYGTGTDNYVGIFGGESSSLVSLAFVPVPFGGTIKNFYAARSGDLLQGTIGIYKNYSTTVFLMTLAANACNGSVPSLASCVAGDKLHITMTGTGGASSALAKWNWMFEIDPS